MAKTWRFFRAGGFDQVRLDSGADLAHLGDLDQKLWVALSCPTKGLEFDQTTLELIDADKDGRIRAPELIAATKWAVGRLKNADRLLDGTDRVALSNIEDGNPDGKALLASAKQILENLGKTDATEIGLEDTADTTKIFAATKFNGDGVLPPESADDAKVRAVLVDIVATHGSELDRSGKPGVTQARVDQFFADLQAFADWMKKADDDKAVRALGDGTAAASALAKTLKPKIDDYFARCRLAAFDARALTALNRQEAEYLTIAAKDLTITSAEIAGFPLARVEPGRPLPLTDGLNPAWHDQMASFRDAVVKPLVGDKSTLTEAEWNGIVAKLAAFDAWSAAKAGASVEQLGPARVREILGGKHKEAIDALIAKDKALEPEANAIAQVDKLLRLHKHLYKLLNNFVSFRDFYSRKDKSVFQAGTLYLDQRSCEFCIRVEDVAKHASLARLSHTYLAYCDLVRRGTGETMSIVAAFTAGDADNLMVGRNGIFYDRQGRDWDATITKIVDNPISVGQAFWSPYKKVVRLVETQIEKFASEKAKEVDSSTAANVETSAAAIQKPAVEATKKEASFDVAKFAGIFAAIGLAIGAIGGALGAMLTAFTSLALWQMPLAIGGIMLVISGPSVLLAALKLRQRNLGPLLDANGWAVNANARVNIPFGGSLTDVAELPAGSQSDLVDPFAESTAGRNRAIAAAALFLVVLGLWYFGAFHKLAPGLPKSGYLERAEAAAAASAPTAAVPKP